MTEIREKYKLRNKTKSHRINLCFNVKWNPKSKGAGIQASGIAMEVGRNLKQLVLKYYKASGIKKHKQ